MSKPPHRVSMIDIARHLNISQATVSYVLSGRASGRAISESTRQRVILAAEEMGYRRNRAAQALAGHGSQIIQFCVSAFFPSYYAQILQAFSEVISPDSYELQIVNPVSYSEKGWARSKGDWPVDGVIADVPLPEVMLASLQKRNIPVVSVGLFVNPTVDHVFVDMAPALLEGLRLLAESSRRVAFVSLWPTSPESALLLADARFPCYRHVMEEMGLREEVILVRDQDNVPARALARQVVRDYVTQHGCPDAFFCFNDERAIGTLAALHDLRIQVPQETQILGFDGILDTEYHHPSLSTIQFPFEQVARLSWEFLRRRMEQPHVALQCSTLTAPLVLRDSTARQPPTKA